MIVDAHQHFWRLDRGDYRFPPPGDPILYRDFLPHDLASILATVGVARTVLVQATDTIDESRFLLDLASATPFVAGVVGWWDPREPRMLDRLLESPRREGLVGVRPMLQRSDDISWLTEPGALSDLSRIAELGLAFDALVDPRHLATIVALGRTLPDLRVVIDHMGKPWRQPDRFAQWLEGIGQLAELPNCWIKVSGFPFASAGDGAHLDFEELVDRLGRLFGVGRMVWGSDWPVVEREGGYAAALGAVIRHFSDDEKAAVLRANARTLYGLCSAPPADPDRETCDEASTGIPRARGHEHRAAIRSYPKAG